MHVTLEYSAQVKRAAGVAADRFEIEPGCTLERLLRLAAETRGDELRRMLFDDEGRVRRSLLLFVGDAQARPQDAVELRDGDVVAIVSPISGG